MDDDLYTVLTISLSQALYGFQGKWRVLKDHEYVFIDKAGKTTQPNEIMRIKGKGFKEFFIFTLLCIP